MNQRTIIKVWRKRIQGIASELAARAGMRVVNVRVQDSAKVQAEYYFSGIIIHKGLLDCADQGLISDQTLQAVIAHEIGHLQRRDTVRLFGWKIVQLLPLRSAHSLRTSARRHLHEAEYSADRMAATLMGAGVTIEALREMDETRRQKEPRLQADDAHPTTDERIAAIRRDFDLKSTSDSSETD